jgi:class 3 adenylate cyclase
VCRLGIEIRAGIHTGEIELRDDGIGGIAVHIGARVIGLAGASEVFASRPVKDLVAGSGIKFIDRGAHTLKGVPDDWQVFQVDAASVAANRFEELTHARLRQCRQCVVYPVGAVRAWLVERRLTGSQTGAT